MSANEISPFKVQNLPTIVTPVLRNALQALSEAVNLATGLTHSNDMNRAKETFRILHENGENLLRQEIESWAIANGWRADDADQLASLAQQIGDGAQVRISGGPWWADNIYQHWSSLGPDERHEPNTEARRLDPDL